MDAKKTLLIIMFLGIPLVLRAIRNAAASTWAPVVPYPVIRSDSWGDGNFGSSRGDRAHQGVDIEVYEGETIYSPIPGKINRIAYPYADDLKWQGVEILGLGEWTGYSIKMFYMSPDKSLIGKTVDRGAPIGKAQAISKKYSPAMQDHIHVELRQGATLLDPTQYLLNAQTPA